MSTPDDRIFDVISHDMHGAPVSCSYCSRAIKRVVVLPLPVPPVLAANSNAADDAADDAWLGVCAYCVLAMAKALQAADESGA